MKQPGLWRNLSLVTFGVTATVLGMQMLGAFQLAEWALLNQWFRLRPAEANPLPIVLVTISEADIRWAGRWPISDTQLATLIRRIRRDRPVAIGLNLYRDLPVEPGNKELSEVYRTTPNLIGIEKAVGSSTEVTVSPPLILRDRGQVAINDLLLDGDGVVRRNLLSIDHQGRNIPALGTKMALLYLQAQGIRAKPGANPNQVQLGSVTFHRLDPNAGGYVRLDNGGFQTLANFLRVPSGLPEVSLSSVMTNQIESNLFRDKLVFMGVNAPSIWGERFQTPYTINSETFWSGVEIHANVSAQLISSAMTGRPMLQGIPAELGWVWVGGWAGIGVILGWSLRSIRAAIAAVTIAIVTLFLLVYGAFLLGWWVIALPSLLAFGLAGLTSRSYWVWETLKQANYQLEQKVQRRTQELVEKNEALERARLQAETANQALERIVRIDELTQVANRRFFNQYLHQEWQRMERSQSPLSLILIDVDFFKLYNDTYGHLAGDECLVTVATLLQSSIQRSTDLIARYGGEEFAAILPHTCLMGAMQVANTIQTKIRDLAIPHQRSHVSSYLTLSMGLVCVIPSPQWSPDQLINRADEALYQAKMTGRDRVIRLDMPSE